MLKALKLGLVGILVGLALFGAGWTVKGYVLQKQFAADTLAANAASRAATDSLRQREADYALYRATADARIVGLETRGRELQRQAQAHAGADRGQDSALVMAQTAADSLPIVLSQRDESRLAYHFATLRGDSLQAAGDSLHALIAQGDSLLALTRRTGAAREVALSALNKSLRLEVDRLEHKGRLFGLIRVPGWVEFAAGVGVGAWIATRGHSSASAREEALAKP